MNTICVKPVLVDGKPARVLDPSTFPPSPLPAWGKEVPLDTYWRRRLAAGEVEKTTDEEIAAARAAAAEAESRDLAEAHEAEGQCIAAEADKPEKPSKKKDV